MATKAATKGRLTRHELKQDKLVDLTYKLEHYYTAHKNLVLGAAVAILVVVAGAVVVSRMMSSAKLEESYELTIAKTAYGTGNLAQAKEEFDKVVGKYTGAAAGEAKYFLGRIAFEQNDFSTAEANFQAYLKDYAVDKFVDASAMSGLAATKEALGQYEEAAKLYEQLAKSHADLPYAPQSLLDAERNYLKLNQKDKAIDLLQTLREKYPESSLAQQAKKELDNLQ
ncbi:tetratricopeptide repeat protein [candidate division KSB1 bacterium]|nr:tetratricopeptide repeat protein [candidate division KSB1 bacterium]